MCCEDQNLDKLQPPEINNNFNSIEQLIQVIQNDQIVQKKIMNMLKQDSYQRRAQLNIWLEQLRKRHASDSLLSALSCLFDNKIAAQVLELIHDR
jgi:hypothetical protein